MVQYGLTQLLLALGARHDFVDDADATIYYGKNEWLGRRAAVWIQPDLRKVGQFLASALPPIGHSDFTFDIARAAAYWMTLEGEKALAHRDEQGRTSAESCPLWQMDALESPPVAAYAVSLSDALQEAGVAIDALPRWPHGCKYAVALTHDVDDPERPSNLVSRAWRSMKSSGGLRGAYWTAVEELRSHGILGAAGALPTRRREWDFEKICECEASLGLRSAFYFSVVNRHEAHPRDVSYDLTAWRYRTLQRRLTLRGWEIGLHAGYDTWRSRPTLHEQLSRMAQWTAAALGIRHHYLRVDPYDPMQSLAEHAANGLHYDTSLGFNRHTGFRCGTALPFQPYHASTGLMDRFVELPMTIADMHLPQRDVGAAISAVQSHLETVRSLGGLAVLNWHVGHWHSAPAWRESYIAACQMAAEDSEAWVATPASIAKWWLSRAAAISA